LSIFLRGQLGEYKGGQLAMGSQLAKREEGNTFLADNMYCNFDKFNDIDINVMTHLG